MTGGGALGEVPPQSGVSEPLEDREEDGEGGD